MNWFKNMKIQNKLFFIFGIFIIMVASLSVVSIKLTDEIENKYMVFVNGSQKRERYLYDTMHQFMTMRRYMLYINILSEETGGLEYYFIKYREAADTLLDDIENYYKNSGDDPVLTKSEKVFRQNIILESKQLIIEGYDVYAVSVYQAMIENDFDKVKKLLSGGTIIGDEITEKLEKLRVVTQEYEEKTIEKAKQYSTQARLLVIIISLVILVATFFILLFMSGIIKEPIIKIKNAIFEIAGGNLKYPIRSLYKDEIGMLSNHIGDMVDTISTLNKSVSILDNLDDMIFVTDFNYNIIYYNRKVSKVFNLSDDTDTVSNLKCYKTLNNEDYPCESCPLKDLEKNKENFPSYEWERVIDLNGKKVWHFCKTSVIRWTDGSYVLVFNCKDDTMRREKEEQLLRFEHERVQAAEHEREQIRINQQSLKTVLDALPIPVRIVDLESNEIVYVNDSITELLEYNSSEELYGLKLSNILPEMSTGGTLSSELIDLTVKSQKLISFEVDYKTKTGKIIETLLSTRHIEYMGKLSSIGIIKDLTKEKERAKILEIAAEQEREANRSKSLFLANMSHEIRTPMNGIIGFSELALDNNEVPKKTRDYLNKIKSSSKSLLQIINDILDISKIEAGKIELERVPFDINEIFKLCRTIMTPKALDKGITLFCYAEPSVNRMLIGDPTRLRQALLNLLSNAVKFTNTGMVKLLSAIIKTDDRYIKMHFEVKDNGIGMSSEQVNKIFNPFEQADNSISRKYGGTGLGLSITKNIIELMGGELKVESALGLGSKFSFDLTFDIVENFNEQSTQSITDNVIEKPLFNGEILVCEDNELNQEVISDHLQKVGLTTTIAVNGRIGVDYVKQRINNNEKPFDLIFMDIHMPVMDGLEASKLLLEMNNKTPVVALTANIMANDRETYQKAGMCDCVPKPFSTQELWSCLVKYIQPVKTTVINKEIQKSEDDKQLNIMIASFVKKNRTTAADIKEAVNSGDIKLAHRLAHTLKGVAGAVGASKLQEAAHVVEQSLAKNKVGFTEEQMITLENELDSALNEFTLLTDEYSNKSGNDEFVDIDIKEAIKTLSKLDILLEADSFDCLMMIDELEKIPETELLIEHIECFNLKQAREVLIIIKENLEKNLNE